ncbi:hypothetical protein ASE86_05265 [Sphingomonas sp. Leaf33]|uniref:hypothetical protein n=1 Tax=Sphingomonas sp. Leaf33 TaxID=1736215 RepID=UPI0006FA6862|nr:hypothetical protein [Sphingomonas sp. Leaf33]KQN25624.1 hypothetical protein ASE86_05265 [Sphingomonas sp. Leaf33]
MIEWRGTQKSTSERANRRLILTSGALGGVMGLALAVATLGGHRKGDDLVDLMLTGPLPVWLVLVLVFAWGVLLPIISWRWHRVVDEHEREAYRDGAVAGHYLMSIGAPVWWLLARADLVRPIDPVAFFAAFIVVSGVVWSWRKYR